MNHRVDYQEAERIEDVSAKLATDVIPESKFECDQANHLLGATTQRQAGNGTTLSHKQALLHRNGNRLRGGSLLHGHRHQYGVSDIFCANQGVSLTGNGESIVSDGRCKHYSQPTHTSHARTRAFFSLGQGSRLESWIQDSLSLSQNSHSSRLAQHVVGALVVVFLHTLEHYLTFPHALQSDPLLVHLPDFY